MLMTRRGRERPGDKTQGETWSYPSKVALSLSNSSKSFSNRTVGFIPAMLSLLGGGSLVKVHWVYLWDQRVWSQTMSPDSLEWVTAVAALSFVSSWGLYQRCWNSLVFWRSRDGIWLSKNLSAWTSVGNNHLLLANWPPRDEQNHMRTRKI